MKNVKKWLGLLLALVLVCSLLPVGALTALAEGEGYELWVGGVQVGDENLSGEGWSFDSESKTLTLTDAEITGDHMGRIVYAKGMDLTLVLSGKSKMSKGISLEQGKLKIQGSGSLTIESAETIAIDVLGDLEISGGCTVTVTGHTYGIYVDQTFTVKGSTVKASSDLGAISCYGATVTDSSVEAVSGDFYGFYSGESLSITGKSKVSAKGSDCAIYGDKGLSIGEGLVITTPKGGVNDGTAIQIDGAVAKEAVIEPTPTYTVTVSAEPAEGGSASADPTSGTEGTEISLTATANEGYSFKEWQVVSGGVTVENDKFTLGAENVELKALFAPLSCTVSFDPNGGSGEMAAVTVNYGEKYKLPENGFTAPADKEFDKWDLGAPGDEIDVTGDMTVKALWKDKTAVTFTVSFDPVGGSGTMADVSVTEGEKYTLPDCSFTPPEGKVFDKWDLGAPGEEIEVTSDLVLKAVWKTATYTVSFNTTGGSYIADQIVEYGKTATEPATDPTRTGYTFDCWCTDKTGTQIFDFNTPIKKDTILYAKWNQAPKYTVVSGGGKVYAKSSGQDLVITVKRNPKDTECFKHFTGVEIDNKALVKDTDYTVEAGSTVVTLKPACLSKLNTGRHIITINFDDGKATTGLTIKAGKTGGGGGGGGKGDSPETGDTSNPALWTGLLLLSGAALGGVIVCARKSRRASR